MSIHIIIIMIMIVIINIDRNTCNRYNDSIVQTFILWPVGCAMHTAQVISAVRSLHEMYSIRNESSPGITIVTHWKWEEHGVYTDLMGILWARPFYTCGMN